MRGRGDKGRERRKGARGRRRKEGNGGKGRGVGGGRKGTDERGEGAGNVWKRADEGRRRRGRMFPELDLDVTAKQVRG